MSLNINKEPLADSADQFSRDAKRQWSKLSDEQIKGLKGDSRKLIEAVKTGYSLSQDEAVKQVESWKKNRPAQGQAGKSEASAKNNSGNGKIAGSGKSLADDRDSRPV